MYDSDTFGEHQRKRGTGSKRTSKGHTLAIGIEFGETTLDHAPLLFLEPLGAVHARGRG